MEITDQLCRSYQGLRMVPSAGCCQKRGASPVLVLPLPFIKLLFVLVINWLPVELLTTNTRHAASRGRGGTSKGPPLCTAWPDSSTKTAARSDARGAARLASSRR